MWYEMYAKIHTLFNQLDCGNVSTRQEICFAADNGLRYLSLNKYTMCLVNFFVFCR